MHCDRRHGTPHACRASPPHLDDRQPPRQRLQVAHGHAVYTLIARVLEFDQVRDLGHGGGKGDLRPPVTSRKRMLKVQP